MRLQVAIDATTVEEALRRAGQVADHVDIFELEHGLLSHAGLAAVEAFKHTWPAKAVVAALPPSSSAEDTAERAFRAGADFVALVDEEDDEAIRAVARVARARRRGVVVTLGDGPDTVGRAQKLRALGAKFVQFSAGEDSSAQPGHELSVRLTPGERAGVPFTVSGGVNPETIRYVQWAGADIAVASTSVWAAPDPASAVRALRAGIR